MSKIQCPPIPADTQRAAASVFGRDHPYLRMGESLGPLWEELDTGALLSADPVLAHSFHPYSVATILQYWEELSDRQMSQATRSRLDLKYALHLPLNFPGFEPSRLCSFRQHVLAAVAGRVALQAMIDRLGAIPCAQKPPAAVEHVLAAVCLPSRAEIIVECMEMALEAVAAHDPLWLRTNLLPHWYRRYEQWPQGYRKAPRNPAEIEALILAAGRDGRHLLDAIERTTAAELARLPEVEGLRREWRRQFDLEGPTEELALRATCCLICENDPEIIEPKRMGKEEQTESHETVITLPHRHRGATERTIETISKNSATQKKE